MMTLQIMTIQLMTASVVDDITDAVFTNTAPLCNQYVGTYTSNVTDVMRNMDFNGETTITEEMQLYHCDC